MGNDDRKQNLGTIALPVEEADIPAKYQGKDLEPLAYHRERKSELGMTWLEYINAQEPPVAGAVDLDSEQVAEAVAEQVAAAVDGDAEDMNVEATVEQALDDLVDDVRSASYQGAREALEEARI